MGVIERKHDFAAKLQQASLLPRVINYVQWQQAARKAHEDGTEPPSLPQGFGPISMNLDLTTACNYRCPHCIDLAMLNGRDRYKHDELFCSIEELIRRGLRSVILIGGGEPTVYPKFPETVRFLKERGIAVGIVTNGSRNERILDVVDCLDERDWVRLSLDSATNETFVRMHKPLKGVSLEGICEWIPKIRAKNPLVQIGFSFIVTWKGAKSLQQEMIIENIDEMVGAAQLACMSGFSYISYKAFLTREEDGAEVMDVEEVSHLKKTMERIRGELSEAKKLASPDFKVMSSINLTVLLEDTWRNFTIQPHMCHVTAFRQVLSPLGVFNCPAHRGEEKAKIAGQQGFLESSFDETNASTVDMLERFDATHECRNVTCFYHGANHWLEDLVSGKTEISSIEELPDRGDYFL